MSDRVPPTDPAPDDAPAPGDAVHPHAGDAPRPTAGDPPRPPTGDAHRPAAGSPPRPAAPRVEVPPPSVGPDPDGDAEREAAWASRPLDPRDYSRRTLLANERTYLAWWRTGLAALAGALAAARVVPELAGAEARWPYTLLGIGFAVAGLLAIAVGHVRRAEVDEAVRRGEFPPLSRSIALAMSGLGLVVGVSTIVLILVTT